MENQVLGISCPVNSLIENKNNNAEKADNFLLLIVNFAAKF